MFTTPFITTGRAGAQGGLKKLSFCFGLALLLGGLTACSDTTEKKTPVTSTNTTAPAAPANAAPQSSKAVSTPQPSGSQATGAAAPAAASGGNAAKQTDAGTTTVFYDFTVVSGPEDANNMRPVRLRYKGREIPLDTEPLREATAGDIEKNVPLKGCETMKVDIFTGGANCCAGYYLLSSCGSERYAAYITPYDGYLSPHPETVADGVVGYLISDPSFMYYEIDPQNGVSLARPSSPRPERFLIFENGAWRVDKPGEFKAAYEKLLQETRDDKDMDPTAKAITVAYYSLMNGKDATAVTKELAKALPDTFSKQAEAIMKELQKAVDGFKPVRNLNLSKAPA